MATSAKDIILLLFLLFSNGGMIVFVVVYGKVFCLYGYTFAISCALFGAVFSYVFFVSKYRTLNVFVPVWDLMRSQTAGILHRQAILAGFFWATNYVCVTAANPFVPGLYQVVINESNLIVVFIASMIMLGNQYYRSQWLCFMIVVFGGFMPLGGSGEKGGGVEPLWFVIYLANAWSIGLANLVMENVMRNLYVIPQDGSYGRRINLISSTQFLTLSNIYAVLWTFTLFWIPLIANPDDWFGLLIRGLKCLWMGQCPESDMETCASHGHAADQPIGTICMWVACCLNALTGLIAANIQRENDVVYVSVALTLAPILSLFCFLIHVPRLYDPPQLLSICSNIVIFVGGFGYKIVTLSYKKRESRPSFITERFKFEPIVDRTNECESVLSASPMREDQLSESLSYRGA